MLAERLWQIAGHVSEGDLQGMMKLLRTLQLSGVTWEMERKRMKRKRIGLISLIP